LVRLGYAFSARQRARSRQNSLARRGVFLTQGAPDYA